MNVLTHTQAQLIVCLEHQNTCLYGEIIQVAEARQIAWVRPLFLSVAVVAQPHQAEFPQRQVYPLQPGVDLLWPISLFRSALDTEVLPLLSQLPNPQQADQSTPSAADSRLNQFVDQVWRAYPEAFGH